MLRWLLCALLLLTALPAFAQQVPLPVRVGILSFEDDPDPQARLKAEAALLLKAQPPLAASFATGTYGELLHWLENDLIDVAVVSPGLYARLSGAQWDYLGSGTLADPHSVLLTRKGVRVDLKAPFQLLAVDPLSVSGFLNPVAALQAAGVTLHPDQVRFTYSHSNSLRYLAGSTGPELACVWAETWKAHPDPALEVVQLPELDKFTSPPVALIGRHDKPATASLAALVKAGKFPGFHFDPRYDAAIRSLPPMPPSLQELSLRSLDHVDVDDLILTLHQYNRTHPTPARFGLVLAGGGAKCSYQAGAVRALEEKLKAAREQLHDPELDLDLIVGTSGGAINAISVAMGLTGHPEGYEDVRRAWSELDQREIICPPLAVRVNLWCWFASIAGLVLLALTYRLHWSRRFALVLTLVVGLLLAGLAHLNLPVRHSTLQHVWAWLSWGVEGAGLVLAAAAVLGLLWRRHFPLLRLLIAGVTLLPLLQTWTICFYEEVVSENKGLEAILTRSFGKLVGGESERRGQGALPPHQTMQSLSREVFTRKLLQRDLVLAASPLTDPKLSLPGEFYFYATPGNSTAPGFGRRGVPLAERPELLFDALLGSAAIYPLFPSRHIENLPGPGQSVELVDGSFAHRSPLEAAVAWGATHVLLIEASTQEVSVHGKLLDNFGQALNYLYDEAQLVDVRLKGQTVLFTLYPSIPHIGLLDFSRTFIADSIEKGYREAMGVPTAANQRGGALHKELGPPVFWTP